MGAGWPIGRSAASVVRAARGGDGGKPKRVARVPHWSSRSAVNTPGAVGGGTLPEQLGPEQGKRRSGRDVASSTGEFVESPPKS